MPIDSTCIYSPCTIPRYVYILFNIYIYMYPNFLSTYLLKGSFSWFKEGIDSHACNRLIESSKKKVESFKVVYIRVYTKMVVKNDRKNF